MKSISVISQFFTNWEIYRVNRTNKISILIGLFFLSLLVGCLFYIGTTRLILKEYYYLTFGVSFLEEVGPGSKVRFNGSFIIGEIDTVTYRDHKNIIRAKIKKGFVIPKKGNAVSIKTWGYFGQKYIDIELYQVANIHDIYTEKEIIPIIEPMNLNARLQNLHLILQEDQVSKTSFLEREVLKTKSLIKNLRSNYYVSRSFWSNIRYNMLNFRTVVSSIDEKTEESAVFIQQLQEDSKEKLKNIRVNLPIISNKIQTFANFIRYNSESNSNISNKYFHYEEEYEHILFYADFINKLFIKWNDDPNTMFSD